MNFKELINLQSYKKVFNELYSEQHLRLKPYEDVKDIDIKARCSWDHLLKLEPSESKYSIYVSYTADYDDNRHLWSELQHKETKYFLNWKYYYRVFHRYRYKRKRHIFSTKNVILILKIASESYGNTIFSKWIPNIASF